tara:strand:- start:296 stop:487 length:192 start_codon:yes stop_codon:yes gene_type:complete
MSQSIKKEGREEEEEFTIKLVRLLTNFSSLLFSLSSSLRESMREKPIHGDSFALFRRKVDPPC